MHGSVDHSHLWVGEYTVLTDKLPDSGDDGLEASLLLGSLLASYSVVISL